MRLLFLNPPSLTTENVVRDSIYGCWCKGKRVGGAMTPPHPLLILATLLRDQGHEVRIIDALAEQGMTMARLERQVGEFDMLILLTSVMTFSEDKQILAILKRANPYIKTVIYGSLPTFMPEFALKAESVDFIVQREAEFTLRDFIRLYSQGDASWQGVAGLGFKQGGQPKVNPPYPLIQDLDQLPLVDWSLLNQSSKYFNPAVKRYPYVTDLTTRGCPGKCTFCMSPAFYGKRVRGRSAANVLEGFTRVARQGYKEVYIRDEMFTALRTRNREICQAMIDRQLDLTWLCSAKTGSVGPQDLELMHRAGCHTLKIGVESGVQEILDTIKKGITLEQVRQLFGWCRQIGLDTHAHFMLGCPGETEDTIRRTIDFAIELKPTTVTFGIMTPYPGTPIFNQVAQKHPELLEDYSLQLSDLHVKGLYSEDFCSLSSEQLGLWSKRAHRAFFLRPVYIMSHLKKIRSFSDIARVAKAGVKVMDFALRGD